MKISEPGYAYILHNEGYHNGKQLLTFIHKETRKNAYPIIQKLNPGDPEEHIVICDGTTTEQVIEVLIDRLTFLHGKNPCVQNTEAVRCLNEALSWLNERTSDRASRDVTGTDKP